MKKHTYTALLSLAAVGLVTLVRRWRTAPPGAKRDEGGATLDEDCAVSECGADGLPLSRYAG